MSRRRRPSRVHGLLRVHKATGPTSHDVVATARRAIDERRVGHTGTLDPMAEGLLLLCVGQAARLQQYLLGWNKTYTGEIRLGQATDTYDAEGKPTEPSGPVPTLEEAILAELVEEFSGSIEQLPPPYSAKKVGGKKLYELARKGEAMPESVKPKTVLVSDLSIKQISSDILGFEVSCASGFYVRSLAHEIGQRLGCGAHLQKLVRTAIGPYELTDAVGSEELATGDAIDALNLDESPAWIELEEIGLPQPSLQLNPQAADRFVNGQEVIVLKLHGLELEAGDVAVVRNRSDRLLGLGTVAKVLARGRSVAVKPRSVITRPVATL